MSKISKDAGIELKLLIGDAVSSNDLKIKANELKIEIPAEIIIPIEKWEKRDAELVKNKQQYSSQEYSKKQTELYGDDRQPGIIGKFLNWIDKLMS